MRLLRELLALGLQLTEGLQPAGAVPGLGGGLGELRVLGVAQGHLLLVQTGHCQTLSAEDHHHQENDDQHLDLGTAAH